MDNLGYKDVIIPQSIFFDRIYPSISIASANASYDGVAEGRYILIDSTNKYAYGWLKTGETMADNYDTDTTFSAAFNNVIFYNTNNFISYQPSVIIRSDNDFLVPVKETESSTTYTIFQKSVNGWAPTEINDGNFSAHDGEIYKKVGNTYQYIGQIVTDSWLAAELEREKIILHDWVAAQSFATQEWVGQQLSNLDPEGEIAIYTGGTGITIDSNNAINFSGTSVLSPVIWADNALTINADSSLQIVTDLFTPLFNKTTLGVRLDSTNGGLSSGANGLYIDRTWLSSHTSGGSGSGVIYSAGTGITISDGAVQEISVKIDDTHGGVISTSDGLCVDSAWLATFMGGGGGAGTVYTAGPGIEITNGTIGVKLGTQDTLENSGCGISTQGGALTLSSEVKGLLTGVTGYSASNGITMTGKTFELDLKASGGLGLDNHQLTINCGTGIRVDSASGALQVNLTGSKSITTNASVGLDHPLEVKCADNNALYWDNDGLKIKLQSNSGLAINTYGLSAMVKSDGGLACDSNGLYVDTTWLSQQTSGGGGGGIVYTAGDCISLDNNTISVKISSAGKITSSSEGLAVDTSIVPLLWTQDTASSTIVGITTTNKTFTSYIVKQPVGSYFDIRGGGTIVSTDAMAPNNVSVFIRYDGDTQALVEANPSFYDSTEIGIVDIINNNGNTVTSVKLYKGEIDNGLDIYNHAITTPVLNFTCDISSAGQRFYFRGFYPKNLDNINNV